VRWQKTTVLSLALLLRGCTSQPVFAQKPTAKVSCLATNYPEVLVHRNADGTSRLEDVDDWRVNCVITLGDKKLFDEALTLPHPTPFRDAMDAIDSFRSKQAPKIIKEKTK
jgi:hypothetical protein